MEFVMRKIKQTSLGQDSETQNWPPEVGHGAAVILACVKVPVSAVLS